MLGIFGKPPGGHPVKTRLQTQLSRRDAERLYLACLADTLETAVRVEDYPTLFLPPGDTTQHQALRDSLVATGLDVDVWEALRLGVQAGDDLGERMEQALADLLDGGDAALLVGSDSPSLAPGKLRRGLELLRGAPGWRQARASDTTRPAHAPPDVVLGPTADGGYYAIGVRRTHADLLRDIEWSSPHTLHETRARAEGLGLRVALLEPWTDVDRPEDLPLLRAQITALRTSGDTSTARHTERTLRTLQRF